ncbi:MAG: hypothetical protein Q7R83_01200, partial [bacterium]|nr:hypothetical protein [bacterium]
SAVSARFDVLRAEIETARGQAAERVMLAMPALTSTQGQLTSDSVKQLLSAGADEEARIENLKKRVTAAIREGGVCTAIAAESTVGDPDAMDRPMEQAAEAELRVEKA